MESIPPTVSTSHSPRSQRSDSSDSLERTWVDRWAIDPETTGSLPGRLWKSAGLTKEQRVDQARAQAAALLQSFDQQFGAGGVESSRPNPSPAIVDPPNFSPGPSRTTHAVSQRWPSCPRCGANVQTHRALPQPSLQIIRCPRLAA